MESSARDTAAKSCFTMRVTFTSPKGTMMDHGHIESLENKHAVLAAKVDEEEHRRHPDELKLHQLKKEKLRLKDVLTGH
jgi:hypothetical protein